MSTEEFEDVLHFRLNKIKSILGDKAKEYADNKDVLRNFNRASKLRNKPREVCLVGMMDKHIVSIYDIIDGIERGEYPTEEMTNEKIGDTINYLILLEASIKHTLNQTKDLPF